MEGGEHEDIAMADELTRANIAPGRQPILTEATALTGN